MISNEEIFAVVKKNPLGIACAVVSLALGAALYLRSDEIPAATDDLAKKSEEGGRLNANLQNAAQLKEQVDTLTTAEKELESRLVYASQTLPNLQYFYKLQTETGVKMTLITQGPVIPQPKSGAKTIYISVPFSVAIQGTMAQAIDYLHRLENGPRYCRVMSMTCGVPQADRGAVVTLALTLELIGLP